MRRAADHPRRGHRRAFLLADMLVGISLIGALTVALAMGIGGYHGGASRLAQSRRTAAVAERVLNEMQLGRRPAATIDGVRVSVRRLADEADAPRGFVWVRVRVEADAQSTELIGLAPRRIAEGSP